MIVFPLRRFPLSLPELIGTEDSAFQSVPNCSKSAKKREHTQKLGGGDSSWRGVEWFPIKSLSRSSRERKKRILGGSCFDFQTKSWGRRRFLPGANLIFSASKGKDEELELLGQQAKSDKPILSSRRSLVRSFERKKEKIFFQLGWPQGCLAKQERNQLTSADTTKESLMQNWSPILC